MNTQPCHFTAVTDEETQKKLADAMSSMKPPAMKDVEPGMPPAMPEGMEGKKPPAELSEDKESSAEAQLLGYGTKIMTAPTMALNNDEYKAMLSIPEGQKIVAVLIVGKPATEEENPDAVSSATTRNAFDEVVTIIGK